MSTYAYRIRRSLRGCRFKLSFGLSLFDEGFCLDFFGLLIALPFLDSLARQPRDLVDKWGVYYFDKAICFCWGERRKSFYVPWMLEHIRSAHQVIRTDGTWGQRLASFEGDDGRRTETHAYRYTLRSGRSQERLATIHVERREYRQRWLRWCPWFAHKCMTLEVEFSDEVGEQTGTWKGGCVACGYEMRPGETPLMTLRRMERERVFD